MAPHLEWSVPHVGGGVTAAEAEDSEAWRQYWELERAWRCRDAGCDSSDGGIFSGEGGFASGFAGWHPERG